MRVKNEEEDIRVPYDYGFEDGSNGFAKYTSWKKAGQTQRSISEYNDGYEYGVNYREREKTLRAGEGA